MAANEPIHTGTAPRSAARPAVVSIVLSPSSARKKATATLTSPARPGGRRRLVVVARRPMRHVHTAKPRNSSPAPTAMARSGTASLIERAGGDRQGLQQHDGTPEHGEHLERPGSGRPG